MVLRMYDEFALIFAGSMRRIALLSMMALLGAQSVQLDPGRIKPRGTVSLRIKGDSPALRTSTLPWLLPNQDYAIVPATASDPNYAEDTLISNGTGPNTRSNPPAVCLGTFFDSLEQSAAYPIVSNERFKVGSGIPSMGIAPYYDGAIAERYDIAPDLGGVNRTVIIKGVALLLINFPSASSNACAPTLADPSPSSGPNGYTFTYALHSARPFDYQFFYNQSKPGTIPASTPTRIDTHTIDQIRIGNLLLGNSGAQCPTGSSVTELFDFAYFSTPVDITDSTSYYVVISTERYNINTYNLTDTLYFLYGPAYSGNINSHPCFNGDTVRLGRSLISWALYDTTSNPTTGGEFYGTPSQVSPTLPDWIPLHRFGPPLSNGLNFVAFPIVYAENITTGVWIRGGTGEILTPYPNPTTDCLNLKVRAPAPSSIQLALHTLDGRVVKSWPLRPLEAGENLISVDVTDVPSGNYLLRAQSDAVRAAFQVTVLH